MSTKILDSIAGSRLRFEARSIEEAAALYIARKFDDTGNVWQYARIVNSLGLRAAAERFRAHRAASSYTVAERERFKADPYAGSPPPSFPLSNQPIIALRVERRSISLGVFSGTQLQYTQTRALPNNLDQAQTGVAAFVRWCFAHFKDGIVAIEAESVIPRTRSSILSEHATLMARECGSAVWEVGHVELLGSLSEPSARSRAAFRNSAGEMWPTVAVPVRKRALLDAVGIGQIVAIKRLFGDTEPREVKR